MKHKTSPTPLFRVLSPTLNVAAAIRLDGDEAERFHRDATYVLLDGAYFHRGGCVARLGDFRLQLWQSRGDHTFYFGRQCGVNGEKAPAGGGKEGDTSCMLGSTSSLPHAFCF